MLYRFLAAGIVLFWFTTTALLVRKEFGPRDTALREVPVAHVGRLMFTHEQPSDLQIYQDKQTVGRLQLQPRLRQDDGLRRLDFTGALQILLPGLDRQAVAWTGELNLDDALTVQRFRLTLTLHDPPGATVELQLDPADQVVTYQRSVSGRVLRRTRYSLDEQGLGEWLRSEGIDPALLAGLRPARSSPLRIRALQSTLLVHGEKIATYLVSAEQGEQTLIEAHVSQLGQVLRVRTFAGYSAAPEDLTP